jgi:predicted permease
VDATATLGAARGASGRRRSRLTHALVGVEVALAVVVVVGSGLMLRSLRAMSAEDAGLDGEGVLVLRPNPPAARYPDGASFRAYYADVLERVASLPQVEAASAIHLLPGTPNNWSFPTYPEGVEIGDGTVPSVNIRLVLPDYFETVGTRLLEGRTLARSDDGAGEKVVVVNGAFVELFWPEGPVVGRTLRIMGPSGEPHRVVGVVADVRQHGLGREPRPEMYFAHAQLPWNTSFWVVARIREGADPVREAPSVREAVWSVDPDVPLAGVDDLARVFGRSAATTRFLAGVLGAFGALALLLGAVGVFGVTTFTVGRRTAEFGVRIAVGASRIEVLRAALAGTLLPVAAGLAVGLLAAFASAGALASALYKVEPTDPVTFALVALTLLAVAVLAALAPAWRASRLDPVAVLRGDG